MHKFIILFVLFTVGFITGCGSEVTLNELLVKVEKLSNKPGKEKEALKVYRQLLRKDILKRMTPVQKYITYMGFGNTLYPLKKYKKAEKYFIEALQVFEANNLVNEMAEPGFVYKCLGRNYEVQKKYKKAKKIYLAGIDKLKSSASDSKTLDIAILYEDLGELCLLESKYSESIKYYKKAISNKKMFAYYGDKISARIFSMLGIAYCHNNQLKKAEKAYLKCMKYASKSASEGTSNAHYVIGLGYVYYKQNKLDKAVKLLDKGYNILSNKLGRSAPSALRIYKLLKKWKSELALQD